MATPQEDSSAKQPPPTIVTEPPKLDLETYIANYEGITRLRRLATIGASSRFLGHDALRLAIPEAKQGKDVDRYISLVQILKVFHPADGLAVVDEDWVQTRRKQNDAETERLEHELKGYKNNLIKESIRMGNEDLGAFYYSTGDYASAFKAYSRMREYCTTPKHISEMSFKLILTAVAQENWMQVQSNVYKIQALQLKPEDKSRSDPILDPLRALAALSTSSYHEASTFFLSSDPAWLVSSNAPTSTTTTTTTSTIDDPLPTPAGIRFNKQVLTANDIATYGGLCALATMSRAELKTRVLDNSRFRPFLELEPHIRRAVACFASSKYTQCLQVLEAYRADYLLDCYLQRHVEALYARIRRKSVVAYLSPFSRVSISTMAEAFQVDARTMEKEVVEMIGEGVLDARVDLVEGVVVAREVDARARAQRGALELAESCERGLRLRLFRINMMEAGLDVKAVGKEEGKGSGGGIGGAGRGKAAKGAAQGWV